MKVISFSLWGAEAKYCVGAERNAALAAQVYPGWLCRFYCGSSVPTEVTARLRAHQNVEVIPRIECTGWDGLFWRFEPASDPAVEVMLSRDTDSRLNERERLAVREWLESGRLFHIMRDHPLHGVPILGGMWGAKRGAVPQIMNLAATWPKEKWGQDQEFLAERIFPLVRADALVHDSSEGGRPFPAARRRREFVGQPFDEHDRPLITGSSALATRVRRFVRRFFPR